MYVYSYIHLILLIFINSVNSVAAVAEDRFGNLYILDGALVRRVDQSGTLSTLVGSVASPAPEPVGAARAVPCGHRPLGFSQLRFLSPSALAYAPADHSLYVLDERLLYRLDLHYAIGYVVAGDARRCSSPSPSPDLQSQPAVSRPLAIDHSQSDAILNGANAGARDVHPPGFRSLLGLVGVHVHPDGDVYLVHSAGVSVLSSATGELRLVHAATDLLGALALTPDQNTMFLGRASNSASPTSPTLSGSTSNALLIVRNEGFERLSTAEYRFIDRERNSEYIFEASGKLVRKTSASGPNLTLTYDQIGLSRVVIRHAPQSSAAGGRAIRAAAAAVNVSVLDFVLMGHTHIIYLQRLTTTSLSPALPNRPASPFGMGTGVGTDARTGHQTGPRVLMRLALQQFGDAMLIASAVNDVQRATTEPVTDADVVEDAEEHRFEYDMGTQLLNRAGRLHLRHHLSSGRLTLATSTGSSAQVTSANSILNESPQQQWSLSVLDAVVESGETLQEVVIGRTGGPTAAGETGAVRTRTLVRVASALLDVVAGGRGSSTVRICLPPTAAPTL